MELNIRPLTSEDYEVLSEIANAIYPEYPMTVADWQWHDQHRKAEHIQERFIAERDGVAVGYSSFNHAPWMFHPHKFWLYIGVHPDYRAQGIGTKLYKHNVRIMQSYDPLVVRSDVREDRAGGMRFVQKLGFREEMRLWESRLDVSAFDWKSYEGYIEQVVGQGLTITTLKELQSDPQYDRKLYEMLNEIDQDVPGPEPFTPQPFEEWVESRLKNPDLIPEAYFVALDGDHYVGTSGLWRRKADNNMWTGLTGVRRSHRRRGIALAMKLCAIAYARDHGHPIIVTDNESNNRPMLSINERLGFVRQPAWIWFRKDLKEA